MVELSELKNIIIMAESARATINFSSREQLFTAPNKDGYQLLGIQLIIANRTRTTSEKQTLCPQQSRHGQK